MPNMNFKEQTEQQIVRFLNKVAEKFPFSDDVSLMTDIHIRASQDSGELRAFDDNDEEITRCVVEEWIDNKDEDFYDSLVPLLRNILGKVSDVVDNLGIIKPYSFVLENDDAENIAELRVCDDDTVIIDDKELLEGLDKELDEFLENLLKD